MNCVNTASVSFRATVGCAAMRREWLSHRLNRFLYAHVALVLVAGTLPLLTPGDALSRGAPWWLLHAVLYAVSLSALLLGLSSAQAEAEEFTWLLGQPAGPGPWLLGKACALAGLAGVSTLGIALPVLLAGGGSEGLAVVALGAAAVAVVMAMAGLVIGFWIRDAVRGLIAAVAVWFGLVFGTDLLLLAVAGAPWVQANPNVWVAGLMVNPLDAYRVTVLFAVEQAAFSGLAAGSLASWWTRHAPLWLGAITGAWTTIFVVIAWLGARRRID